MIERRSHASPGRATLVLAAALLFACAITPYGRAGAAGEARALRWADLVPPLAPADAPAKPKALFPGAQDQSSSDGPPAAQLPEGKFMSVKRRQPGAGAPPPVVAELDGVRVSIGGYVVPLDFEATTVKEFLLVPFVGACIHVPPPPANQIVYVKSAAGFDVAETFEPVTVTGTIRTASASTGLADAGYTIEAEEVAPRKE